MGFNGNLFLWAFISMLCLILDIFTSTFLFVWFTIGGIAAIITLTLGGNLTMQIIAFVVTTGISFIIGYPIVKKVIRKDIPKTPTMEEKYIGRVMVAEKPIETEANIKVDGIYWSVRNEGEPLAIGEKFTITKIQGNKLIIKK